MSKEEEVNDFSGFNLLSENGLKTPEKVVKKPKQELKKEEDDSVSNDADDKALEALEAAKKEADEIAEKKNKKHSKQSEEKSEEEEEQEEDDDSGNKKSTSSTSDEESSLKAFAGFLKEEGMAEYEDDKFEDSTEGLKRIWQDSLAKRHDDYVKSFDEDTQKYLEFVEAGGRPADFHKYYYNDASFEEFDLESEENQKHAIREGLKLSGWEDEAEIEDEISLYEDAGKLQTKAASHLSRLQKAEKENKKMIVEVQKKHAKDQEEAKRAEWKAFKDGLFEKESISGFTFSKKMKDDLWDYMTKPVDKKTGESQYNKDSSTKGAEARYIFAYLMKNNWNIESLKDTVKNKVVNDVKKKLSSFSDTRSKIKSGTSKPQEEETSSSFAGFKNFLK